MASSIVVKNLGFTGSALIDNQQVLVTGGSITQTQNISYLNPLSIPNPSGFAGTDVRTRVKYSDGTYIVNGSMTFDLTAPALRLLRVDAPIGSDGITGLLKRGRKFNIDFFGGNQNLDAFRCTECFVTSLSANGGVGGIINVNLSFMSKNEVEPIIPSTVDGEAAYGSFIRDQNNLPLGYWYSGQPATGSLAANVQDWTLDFSQEANPVYLNGWVETSEGNEGGDINNNDMYPQYIRIGTVTYGLSVTTIGGIYPTIEEGNVNIIISTQSFNIQAIMSNITYNLARTNGLSTFSHTFEGYADITEGSGGFVIG